MSVGKLKQKQQTQQTTKNLKEIEKSNPKEYSAQEESSLYQVSFLKPHSILLHLTPPNSTCGLCGSCLPSGSWWISPSMASGFQLPSMLPLSWGWTPDVRTAPVPVHIICSYWNRQTPSLPALWIYSSHN